MTQPSGSYYLEIVYDFYDSYASSIYLATLPKGR